MTFGASSMLSRYLSIPHARLIPSANTISLLFESLVMTLTTFTCALAELVDENQASTSDLLETKRDLLKITHESTLNLHFAGQYIDLSLAGVFCRTWETLSWVLIFVKILSVIPSSALSAGTKLPLRVSTLLRVEIEINLPPNLRKVNNESNLKRSSMVCKATR